MNHFFFLCRIFVIFAFVVREFSYKTYLKKENKHLLVDRRPGITFDWIESVEMLPLRCARNNFDICMPMPCLLTLEKRFSSNQWIIIDTHTQFSRHECSPASFLHTNTYMHACKHSIFFGPKKCERKKRIINNITRVGCQLCVSMLLIMCYFPLLLKGLSPKYPSIWYASEKKLEPNFNCT